MIKNIIKVLLITFLTLLIVIFYLSTFGIKTDKFNSQIISNILKINKKVNLSLSDVNYLLNPYNFTINIRTKNPQILLEDRSLDIKNIQTNVALKALINNQFSIDDLQITTKEIKLNDIISLARVFQNSPQLFILDKVIKNGFVTANINLSFDEKGKVKENYRIEGSIKRAKINIINQFKLKNLNFDFDINQNDYSLKKIDTKFDNIEITSPLIEIKHKKNSFFINGQILNDTRKFDIEELKPIFSNLPNDINLQEIEFSSKNNFSFNVNKKLKFNNLKVQSIIELNKLTVNEKI